MDAKIIRTYRQEIPAIRFIGKKYGDEDRENGMFSHKWMDWFQSNRFGEIEKLDMRCKTLYEDSDAYIGLMRFKEGEPFEYWIGMFMPEGTTAPDGFEYRDFPKSNLGVCWVQGAEPDVYMQEERCWGSMIENDFELTRDSDGAWWFFERYQCPRFTEKDNHGNIILDICSYVI